MSQNIKFNRQLARERFPDWNDRCTWDSGDSTREFYFNCDWINDIGSEEFVITDTRKHLKTIVQLLLDQDIEFSVY